MRDEFGVPFETGTFEELLRRDDIDVIDLCTPPFLHRPQAEAALAAGKHVVCEKPLVTSLRDADALLAAERASGRTLMPIFQQRWGGGMARLRHLQALGLTGKRYLSTVETSWKRGADYYAVPWRGKWKTEGGGVSLGHSIHPHDGFCLVAGPIRSVFARVATRVNPIETEDCISVPLEMADGSLASLSATLGSAEEITRLRFCFEHLVAESGLAPYTYADGPWRFVGETPAVQAEIDAALAGFPPPPFGYPGQFRDFGRALAAGQPPPVTLAEARTALELITAIYHSARTGQAVTLPLDASHPLYGG